MNNPLFAKHMTQAYKSGDWENERILIVEDSPTQALFLENLLKQKKCKVDIAIDGIDALRCMNENIPSVVISDVMMPNMNGYELCSAIKTDPRFHHIPLMLLTSLCDPVDVIKGIECGADNFLVKPYPKDLLFFHIENILENRKLREKSSEQGFLEFYYAGVTYKIPMNPVQITDLLLSTYSSAIEKNAELHEVNRQLNIAKEELTVKNEELIRLNEELILLNQQKNHFLGMAAHDLRNPLGVIQGFSSFLKESLEEKIDKESLSMLESINNSTNFMINLINEYLDVAVIESGKIRLDLKKQDLRSFVLENIRLNEKAASKKKMSIIFQADPSLPEVAIDPNRFEQVLNNVIGNAVKFSPFESTVQVNLNQVGDEVILTVRDQGIGIPPNQIDKLFGLFGRLVSRGTAGEPTTGLGLAIAKKIISEHHGRIWVESELGKGSTFSIALPIAR
jgi:hypothetical protein